MAFHDLPRPSTDLPRPSQVGAFGASAHGVALAINRARQLLLRDFTLDAPNCRQPVQPRTALIACNALGILVCAPNALCAMSDDPRAPSPLCTCPPPEPNGPLFDWQVCDLPRAPTTLP